MADRKNKISLEWFFLSFLGQTTPDDFWGIIKDSDIRDGFLPRFLFFESCHEKPLAKTKVSKDIPAEIIFHLKNINQLIDPPMEKVDDNFQGVRIPDPFIIEKTVEAGKVFDEYKLKFHNLSIQATRSNNKNESSFYNRAHEAIDKISLIIEFSKRLDDMNKIENVKVTEESMLYSCRLIDFMMKRTIAKVRNFVYENENEQMQKKILTVLDSFSSMKIPAIKRTKLVGSSRSWNSKTFDLFIMTLLDRGEIGTFEKRNRNNVNVRYYYLPKFYEKIKIDTNGELNI
jgi:hypothetical protein